MSIILSGTRTTGESELFIGKNGKRSGHLTTTRNLKMKAIWNGEVVAESDLTIVLENIHYFPPESLNHQFLKQSNTTTTCPWKGVASYWDVIVNGQTARDSAFAYQAPKDAASHIRGYFAFWRGVEVTA